MITAPELADILASLRRKLEALPSSKRLSFTDTEAIYAIADNLVAQGRYADALRRFAILTLYRPTEAKYLHGLAVCNQKLGRYDYAIGNFAFAASLEPGNPVHMLAIAECEVLQKNYAAAQETLATVTRFCTGQSTLGPQCERAEAMLALLPKD